MEKSMTLDKGEMHKSYEILRMELPLELERRMESLGMIKGTVIRVMNTKAHGTLILKVRGTRFAVGKGISGKIFVREVAA